MFDNCPFFFCSVYMHKMLRVMLTSLVISGWWNLGYIVFLHMAFPPLWIMSMCLAGKASQRTASPPHAPPHENDLGPGTFPCREIKRCSSQPVLGISLRLPLSILGLICSSLFCLSMCATWHLTSPTATSVPSGEGVETFACSPRRVCADHHCISPRVRPTGRGDPHCSLLNLMLLFFFSVQVKHCIQCLGESSFLATPPPASHAVGWHLGAAPNGQRCALCCPLVGLLPWRWNQVSLPQHSRFYTKTSFKKLRQRWAAGNRELNNERLK